MTIQPINRSVVGADDIEAFAMANCLMILSSQTAAAAATATADPSAADIGRMFSCKTCGKKFSSFQALGGHRASHKKIKPATISGEDSDEKSSSPTKPKTHACSICGLEFPIGQALGGHMRRHRPLHHPSAPGSTITTEGSTEKSDGNSNGEKKRKKDNETVLLVPVLKKSSSSKRVCLDLDLNLAWGNKINEEDHDYDHDEAEEGEIVEQDKDEEKDFLKLELRQPINWAV